MQKLLFSARNDELITRGFAFSENNLNGLYWKFKFALLLLLKKKVSGARELTWGLRLVAALQRTQVLVPTPTWQFTNSVTPVPGIQHLLLFPVGTGHTG